MQPVPGTLSARGGAGDPGRQDRPLYWHEHHLAGQPEELPDHEQVAGGKTWRPAGVYVF